MVMAQMAMVPLLSLSIAARWILRSWTGSALAVGAAGAEEAGVPGPFMVIMKSMAAATTMTTTITPIQTEVEVDDCFSCGGGSNMESSGRPLLREWCGANLFAAGPARYETANELVARSRGHSRLAGKENRDGQEITDNALEVKGVGRSGGRRTRRRVGCVWWNPRCETGNARLPSSLRANRTSP